MTRVLVSNPYTIEELENDIIVTGEIEEEPYVYDGAYGPIPDENGLVDLTSYGRDYISGDSYNMTKIPEENQKYLDSGLKATSLNHMFNNYKSLTHLDLSKIDTSNVNYANYLFDGCKSLTDVKGVLDFRNVSRPLNTFRDCSANAHIHLKNVSRSSDFSQSGGIEGQQYIIDNYID